MKNTKQEILRLACLSYSIVMLSISNKYADKAKEAIDLLKAKKIITEKEIRQRFVPSIGNIFMDKIRVSVH